MLRSSARYDGSGRLIRTFIYGTGIDEPVRMTVLQPSADIAGGGSVDMDDLHDMAAAWLTGESDGSYNAAADLSLDGRIDNVDSDILAANWQNTTGTRPARHYYYHFDGLGSVVALTDSAGSTAEQYTYNVYGAVLIRDADGKPLPVSLLANPYFFTARRFDTETGLYYYRARYYDPYLGRFLQVDAIGYDDGMNLYAYVGNSPVVLVDPLGLCGEGEIGQLVSVADQVVADLYQFGHTTLAAAWAIEYGLNRGAYAVLIPLGLLSNVPDVYIPPGISTVISFGVLPPNPEVTIPTESIGTAAETAQLYLKDEFEAYGAASKRAMEWHWEQARRWAQVEPAAQ